MLRALAISVALAVLANGAHAQQTTVQPPELTPQQKLAMTQIVKDCVVAVHEAGKAAGIDAVFFSEFDAYYDSIRNRLFDNGTRAGDARPRYVLHKCLMEHSVSFGGPL